MYSAIDLDTINVVHLDSCTSTNEIAKALNKTSRENISLILADMQTAGKGRNNKSWSSEKNEGWYFSFHIPNINIPIAKFASISWSIALALNQFFKDLGISTLIKWPNDIYTTNGKISGILIENSIEQNKVKSSVIGVGINLQVPKIKHTFIGVDGICNYYQNPNNLNENKISFIKNILQYFLTNIELPYGALNTKVNQYVFGLNKWFNFDLDDLGFDAKVTNIDLNGNLNLTKKTKEKVKVLGKLVWNYAH